MVENPELDLGARPRRQRTTREMIDAIPAAQARAADFKGRVQAAWGEIDKMADLMAEAIAMDREARSMSSVGRDGRLLFTSEMMFAAHCLDAAREGYLLARMSNDLGLGEKRDA